MRTTLCTLIAILAGSLFLSSCATNGEEPELPDSSTNPSIGGGPIGNDNYIYSNPSTYQLTHTPVAHGK